MRGEHRPGHHRMPHGWSHADAHHGNHLPAPPAMTPTKSPNVARQLQKAVREACLPVAEKALLRELAASYHAETGGAAPKKDNLIRWCGFVDSEGKPDPTMLTIARDLLKAKGLISWVHREKQTTLYLFNVAAIEQLAAAQPALAGAPAATAG